MRRARSVGVEWGGGVLGRFHELPKIYPRSTQDLPKISPHPRHRRRRPSEWWGHSGGTAVGLTWLCAGRQGGTGAPVEQRAPSWSAWRPAWQ